MAYKSYIYPIFPNKAQDEQCQKTFGCCRFIYNFMIDLYSKRLEDNLSLLGKYDANTYCNRVLKTQYPFLKDVDKCAITNSIFHFWDGYHRFLQHLSNRPKYKKKHKSIQSYSTDMTNNNIAIGNNYIKLPKLGKVKAKIYRTPKKEWKIKSATIKQNSNGQYQAIILFQYDKIEQQQEITEQNTIGLDYKLNGLYCDSNGHICQMPHYYQESLKKIKREQNKLKNKIIGSQNYIKQKRKITKLYQHVSNQRKDFLHKESTAIAKQYSCVCVENLDLKNMKNNTFHFGKLVMDNGYNMFLSMLNYKLNDKGGMLIIIDKYFPSSQICNCCGFQNKLVKNLKIRQWDCPSCGTKNIDRDHNAAKNIKMRGLELLNN